MVIIISSYRESERFRANFAICPNRFHSYWLIFASRQQAQVTWSFGCSNQTRVSCIMMQKLVNWLILSAYNWHECITMRHWVEPRA